MKMNAKELARKIAEESIVLLKNKNYTLPFKEGQKAAFFGRAQIHTVFSGNGSGASKATEVTSILMECEKQGICVEPELKSFIWRRQLWMNRIKNARWILIMCQKV